MIQREFLQHLYERTMSGSDHVNAYPIGIELGLTRSQVRGMVEIGALLGYLERAGGPYLCVRFTEAGKRLMHSLWTRARFVTGAPLRPPPRRAPILPEVP